MFADNVETACYLIITKKRKMAEAKNKKPLNKN